MISYGQQSLQCLRKFQQLMRTRLIYTHRGGENFDFRGQRLSSAVLERLTQITNARCRQHYNSRQQYESLATSLRASGRNCSRAPEKSYFSRGLVGASLTREFTTLKGLTLTNIIIIAAFIERHKVRGYRGVCTSRVTM